MRRAREVEFEKVVERYEDAPSTESLELSALRRRRNRPNKSRLFRQRLLTGLAIAVALPSAYLAYRSISKETSKDNPACIGAQTLTVPEGGASPVELVEQNLGNENVDAKNIVIKIHMAGSQTVHAANASFSIPEGVEVDVPAACVGR
ncbi:MAG TPA: hypothetical protein VFX86_02035 [Candidatus Saccharimonadales bacterium]|nr:hypothetical protein [Candidatus Saccharimonadales bacterium]